MTAATGITQTTDPHEQTFKLLVSSALKDSPRLLDIALRPVNRPEQHPLVRLARHAAQIKEGAAVRERILRQLNAEIENAADCATAESRVEKAIAVYDAAISGNPVALREAVRTAARAGSRSEWSEAV